MSIRNELLEGILTATINGGVQPPLIPSAYNPANIAEIYTSADLDALATGGIITVTEELTLVLKGQSIITAVKFIIDPGGTLIFSSEGHGLFHIVYTLGDTFITANNGTVQSNFVKFISTAGATFISANADSKLSPTLAEANINDTFIIGFHLGSITSLSVIFRNCIVVDWLSGISLNDTFFTSWSGNNFIRVGTAPIGASVVSIKSKYLGSFNFSGSGGVISGGDTLIDIDAGIESQDIIITGSTFRGEMFNQTAGATGAFTSIADDSITATAITSVTDNAGAARFNFTGPNLYVDQVVDTSTFATNPHYNGLIRIEVTDGTSYFEGKINSVNVLFGSDESGSFTSDRITMTEAATSLIDGDSFRITNEGVLNYEGGHSAYNVLTNSFQINSLFLGDTTGVWDKTPIKSDDVRLTVTSNSETNPSKSLGSVIVTSNTVATNTSTTNQWVDFNLNSLAVPCSNIERWSLIDSNTGEVRHNDKVKFVGQALYSLSLSSSGGGQEFEFRLVKNGAPLIDNVIARKTLDSDASVVMLVVPVTLIKDDLIRPQVRNISGSSTMVVEFMSGSIR